eukprot:TRINITY_DN633_c0_g2_i1.p1 TRINITY_DN633_c0_g2~~TRINITY_DN633_c0_g2_i1.p1  ORF type:complete len:489 (+),score=172.63 TRINITY_DN633_c0_g2_i1:26-1468(+)
MLRYRYGALSKQSWTPTPTSSTAVSIRGPFSVNAKPLWKFSSATLLRPTTSLLPRLSLHSRNLSSEASQEPPTSSKQKKNSQFEEEKNRKLREQDEEEDFDDEEDEDEVLEEEEEVEDLHDPLFKIPGLDGTDLEKEELGPEIETTEQENADAAKEGVSDRAAVELFHLGKGTRKQRQILRDIKPNLPEISHGEQADVAARTWRFGKRQESTYFSQDYRPVEEFLDFEEEEREKIKKERQELERPDPSMEVALQKLREFKEKEAQERKALGERLGALQRKDLSSLRYFHYYPSEVKRWMMWARMPRGFFYKDGTWREIKYFDGLFEMMRQEEIANSISGKEAEKLQLLQAEKPLPPDLANAYRFGLTDQDLQNLPDNVRRLMSFHNATIKEIRAHRNQNYIDKFGRKPGDSGSPEIQICSLTQRIRQLTDHLKKNVKDRANGRNLSRLVERRKQLMRYLKARRPVAYYTVLKEIGLRDSA